MPSFAPTLAIVSIATAASATPTFWPAGDLPGGGFLSEIYAVSANGSSAVGRSVTGGGGFSPITDPCLVRLNVPMVSLGSVATSAAYAVNADATAVVGVSDFGAFDPRGSQAFLWTAQTGIVLLGDLNGGAVPHSIARGVSQDGQVIAGIGESLIGNEAFRYTVSNATFQPLGTLSALHPGSFGYGLSGDGSTVVGISYDAQNNQQAFRWTASTGIAGMGFLPQPQTIAPYSAAYAANFDGSVIVGQSRSADSGSAGEAFRWTAAGGMQPLGDFATGAFQSLAYAVSSDGTVVGGRASVQGTCGPFGCGSAPRAFIWDSRHGMRDLGELLTQNGVDLTGWRLDEVRGISSSGRIVVGIGFNPASQIEGWMVDLDILACRADFNDDLTVDFFDYLDFVSVFAAQSAIADFNSDGAIDLFDYLDFADQFSNGCE